ncbi:hypothetical protein MMC14_008895 [Varicellaria rhodocarpa]|nr:hypothetical protein [Varicellaria rhodocarpa]
MSAGPMATTLEDDSNGQKDVARLIDLSHVPPIYVLPTHLTASELDELKAQLSEHGATLTHDVLEARLVLGAISTSRRAKSELQWRNLDTEPIDSQEAKISYNAKSTAEATAHPRKRRKLSGPINNEESSTSTIDLYDTSSTESESENNGDTKDEPASQLSMTQVFDTTIDGSRKSPVLDDLSQFALADLGENLILVVKTEWWTEALHTGKLPRLDPYIIYKGKRVPKEVKAAANKMTKPLAHSVELIVPLNQSSLTEVGALGSTTDRTRINSKFSKSSYGKRDRFKDVVDDHVRGTKFASVNQRADQHSRSTRNHSASLIHETTSEHDEGGSSELPDLPSWVKENKIYSCERITPLHSPNDDFIEQLKKIKLARTLTADEIGVRAYSTSIASLAAYPYKLSSAREILALPGCDQKIAHLFHEWQVSGHTEAVNEFDADPVMKILRSFYNIWGVGATTARQFYYDGDKQWKDFDDIIINGWDTLSRVQQIGVKYYDEFELQIPRLEVESIASVVTGYARDIVDDGIECIIVGSYRRGKLESGDVDLILSHREEEATLKLITPMINVLERAGWITHCLTLSEANSHRDQKTLPYRSNKNRGAGFDTLDKGLVVWQNPEWPTKREDLAANPKAKNPNVHRRVDIIISPWRTVGCAVVGWSGGTTFQRDLRRYAKHIKGWKFDSSGVRQRGTGNWVDLERWTDPQTRARTWQEAERRVFEGFGLEYKEPWERCTG